jgi:3-phenylpropionate/cinnamic acid dioxygenase small subunit
MSDLQAILDREHITDLVNGLFVAVDTRDWKTAASCFAERVHFDMTSAGAPAPTEMTPDQIVDGWRDGLEPIQAVHHQSGNIRVRVTGDAAECSCYGIAYHYRPVRSGRNTRVFVGSYDYRLARLAGAWRITRFKFNLEFVEGNLALEREEPA